MKVEFYIHNLGDEEKQSAMRVLDSIFLTTGEATYEFERKFSEYLGVPHTVGVMSATAALHHRHIVPIYDYGAAPGDAGFRNRRG